MDEAEAAYQYCKTDISIESEYQTYIRDVIEKLYYCIKANVLVDELESEFINRIQSTWITVYSI